jgi:hypothetical protein
VFFILCNVPCHVSLQCVLTMDSTLLCGGCDACRNDVYLRQALWPDYVGVDVNNVAGGRRFWSRTSSPYGVGKSGSIALCLRVRACMRVSECLRVRSWICLSDSRRALWYKHSDFRRIRCK